MNRYRSSGSSVQTEIEEIFPPENTRLYTKYTKRNIVKMLLNFFVLDTGVHFPIPLGEKVAVGIYNYSIESLSIGILKEYIWECKKNILKDLTDDASKLDLWQVNVKKVVDVYTDDDIVQKLGGKKMEPNYLCSDYFDQPPEAGKIHIIIQPQSSTNQGLTDVSRYIAKFGYLPRQGGLGGTLLPTDLKLSSSNEGVIVNHPDTSRRFDIIPSLINDLINNKVILVRAPPFSGKTSMAQILEDTLIKAPEFSKYRVIRISLIWKAGIDWSTFGERWKKIVGISWQEWTDQCDIVPSILIVDDAQLIYGKEKEVDDNNNKESADAFWKTVKGALQDLSNIYIIMFAAYGYTSTYETGLTTPVTLSDSHCKGLTDINFKGEELKIYVTTFCSNYFKSLDHQGILDCYRYIQSITEGHAGLVRHVLTRTEDAMKKRIHKRCLTFGHIFKYLNSEGFSSSIYSYCRAVPIVSKLSISQRKICEEIYLNGKVRYNDSIKDMVHLVKTGFLVIKEGKNLTFAAPLLKRSFFQQNYGFERRSTTTPDDLHHFIVKIFTALCDDLSGEILRKTLGFGSDGRILEQTWQKEFYRVGTNVLGPNHFLSCEVGSVFGCEGKIDFYVDEKDWAIELLRDGEDMKEHSVRFEPLRGEYKEIVQYAESIAIIDIRSVGILDTCSEVKKVRQLRENFIYVSCSENFDAFKIESLGKKTETIRFQD